MAKKTRTPEEKLEHFKGRFGAFLNPGAPARRAKLHQVPPARRISQDRLVSLEKLHAGLISCLDAYELSQKTLVDDVRRGVPVEPGEWNSVLGKLADGREVMFVSGPGVLTHHTAGKLL